MNSFFSQMFFISCSVMAIAFILFCLAAVFLSKKYLVALCLHTLFILMMAGGFFFGWAWMEDSRRYIHAHDFAFKQLKVNYPLTVYRDFDLGNRLFSINQTDECFYTLNHHYFRLSDILTERYFVHCSRKGNGWVDKVSAEQELSEHNNRYAVQKIVYILVFLVILCVCSDAYTSLYRGMHSRYLR